jgi:hypothetical protein
MPIAALAVALSMLASTSSRGVVVAERTRYTLSSGAPVHTTLRASRDLRPTVTPSDTDNSTVGEAQDTRRS